MIKINEIGFVSYPTKDIKKACEFYEGVLGLKKTSDFGEDPTGGKWVEFEIGNGAALGLGQMDGWLPNEGGGCAAFEVEHFDNAISKLKENNVVFTMEAMETPVCHMAVCKDLDGNSFIIHKRK